MIDSYFSARLLFLILYLLNKIMILRVEYLLKTYRAYSLFYQYEINNMPINFCQNRRKPRLLQKRQLPGKIVLNELLMTK